MANKKGKSYASQRPVKRGRIVKRGGTLGRMATQSGVRKGRPTRRRQ